MKVIMITFPTSLKELRERINNSLKWLIAPKRRSHNAAVLAKLQKEICSELNSGYWDKDITPYMREQLTMGFPNGKINRMINNAFKDLI